MNARDVRWWFERWVVAGLIVIKNLRFPIRVNIDIGVDWRAIGQALDDGKEEWEQRDWVQNHIWTHIATQEDREKFGKTEFNPEGDRR